jgi:uncharacterized protein (UPF0303 family)
MTTDNRFRFSTAVEFMSLLGLKNQTIPRFRTPAGSVDADGEVESRLDKLVGAHATNVKHPHTAIPRTTKEATMARPEPTYTIEQLESEPVANVSSFTRDDAVKLGEIAVGVIREWDRNLAVDIHIGDELAYRAQLGRTGQGNADVIQGKILVVKKFGHSSLLARLKRDADPSIADGTDESYKFWGGVIPIFVDGELVGSIGTSGEADVVDHEAAAEAITRYLADVAR